MNIDNISVIDISLIQENTRNPNKMEPQDFHQLMKSLHDSFGNHQWPIIIRKHPELENKYEIVDGAHRYRAMKELGFQEIIVSIQDMSDKDARIKTIAMNKFRGESDNILLANLIKDLKESFDMTNQMIQDKLWFSEEQIEWLYSLLDFDFEKHSKPTVLEDENTAEKIDTPFIISLPTKLMNQLNQYFIKANLWEKKTALFIMLQYFTEEHRKNTLDNTLIETIKQTLIQTESEESIADSFIPENILDEVTF